MARAFRTDEASAAAERPRILIVEPNKTNLAVLARRLTEVGYRATSADSAASAVAELHRVHCHIVLAELTLCGSSGVELVRMIRDSSVFRDLPVVLIAGRSERRRAVQAFETGADEVVVKPFHFEVLIARIGRELERARSVKELRHDNQALDARVVERAIAAGELRARLAESEAERRRLQGLIKP